MKGLKRSLRSKPLLNPPLDRGGEIYPCPVKGKGRDRVWEGKLIKHCRPKRQGCCREFCGEISRG